MGDIVQFGRRGHQTVAEPFDSAAFTVVRDTEHGSVTVLIHDVEGADLTPERNRALSKLLADAMLTLSWSTRQRYPDAGSEVMAIALLREDGKVTAIGDLTDFEKPEHIEWLHRTADKIPALFRDLVPIVTKTVEG